MRELNGTHVWLMLGAFFGITIAVNVVMSSYAIRTFSGEDVSTPYIRGLAYNETLRERASQAALGWKVTIDAVRGDTKTATLNVRILDKDGSAKSSLNVTATLRRPTNAALDRKVSLNAAGDGVYRVDTADVEAGQWDVIVSAKDGDGAVFEAQRRVVLK